MTIALKIQSTTPEETRAAWQPLVEDLNARSQLDITVTAASQADTLHALAGGNADLAWLSSGVAIDAVADAGAEVFALYYNVNGANGYKAVIAARADSGIRTIEDALTAGRWRYAGGTRGSTSGYVLPRHFLFAPRKTTAEALFKSFAAGGHFPNLQALWARQVDVIVSNSTDLAVFQARTPGAREGIVTLWESPLVPNDVPMARQGMPADVRQRLADLFLSYGQTQDEKDLFAAGSGISHFVAADDRVLEPVSGFKFASERALIEQSDALDTGQKAFQFDALDRRAEKFSAAVTALMAG